MKKKLCRIGIIALITASLIGIFMTLREQQDKKHFYEMLEEVEQNWECDLTDRRFMKTKKYRNAEELLRRDLTKIKNSTNLISTYNTALISTANKIISNINQHENKENCVNDYAGYLEGFELLKEENKDYENYAKDAVKKDKIEEAGLSNVLNQAYLDFIEKVVEKANTKNKESNCYDKDITKYVEIFKFLIDNWELWYVDQDNKLHFYGDGLRSQYQQLLDKYNE